MYNLLKRFFPKEIIKIILGFLRPNIPPLSSKPRLHGPYVDFGYRITHRLRWIFMSRLSYNITKQRPVVTKEVFEHFYLSSTEQWKQYALVKPMFLLIYHHYAHAAYFPGTLYKWNIKLTERIKALYESDILF